MATVFAPGGVGYSANLSTGQTTSAVSTNIIDRGSTPAPPNAALLRIVTTIGGGPTCTYAVEVSPDGTSWLPAVIADSATPTTYSVATFVVTTATTLWKIVRSDIPWRFLRITYSANTNVTNTADVWVF